jgi:DNA (cytosine-5)-methyltransferase 1
MKINLLDLFSGIGGFHLGLSQAGFKVNSYYSEIDKYAIKTYNHNFKNSTYVGSVTDVRGAELPRINAITFGSPCQDFSLAGKRKGMEGSRSSLILEAIRLIEECRPDFFIWENVKGTFSSNNRQDFAAILQAFTNIGGYRLEWQLLNTKWFLPQNRERIYLVGYAPNRSRGQVFPIGENCFKNIKLQRQQGNTCTLTTRYEAGGNGSYIIERELNAQKVIGYSRDKKGKVTSYHEKDETNTLHSSSGGGGNTDQYIINQQNIRRLTPIECERLQGFPDNWTLAEDNSDTQRYKMCGNAVTVDVVREVAKRIKKTLYWT